MTFYVFLSCCTRFLEHWLQLIDTPFALNRISLPGVADRLAQLIGSAQFIRAGRSFSKM